MTATFPLTIRESYIKAAVACAALTGSSAFALDLTNLINQATTLQTQAGQIQALIPGQLIPGQNGGAAPVQQAPQGVNQATAVNSPGVMNSGAASGQMQVITALQMQWRADGCVFTQPQEISCQVTVLNQGADRKLYQPLRNVSMIDSQGTEYLAKSGGFGKNESQEQVFANGVATVGVFRFRSVDPSTVAVKRLAFNGQQPIIWSDVSLSKGGGSLTTTATGLGTSTLSTLGGLLGQGTATTAGTAAAQPAKTATLVTSAATTANGTTSTAPATLSTQALSAQTGTVQPASQDARRAQHMAVRAAMAASAGKASH